MPTKYILFCGQEANFQTRSMLIPYDQIMQCPKRVEDLNLLRLYSQKDQTFNVKGVNYTVDQLLTINYIWKDNKNVIGHQEHDNTSVILSDFINYADGLEEDHYLDPDDKIWYDSAILMIASSGFNHVRNYCTTRVKTAITTTIRNTKSNIEEDDWIDIQVPVEIVEGFLVLETRDGQYKLPMVDTVEELYAQYEKNSEDIDCAQTIQNEN